MPIIIDHERLGVRSEFTSLPEAQASIVACGPEFAGVVLVQSGDLIYDERGECVGYESSVPMPPAAE